MYLNLIPRIFGNDKQNPSREMKTKPWLGRWEQREPKKSTKQTCLSDEQWKMKKTERNIVGRQKN